MAEKETNIQIIVSFHFVPTECVFENSKQITKIFKKLENTIMTSFQAKIRGETLINGENKKYHPFPFQPDA